MGVNQAVFKEQPVTITDRHGEQVQTILEYRSGALTWISALVICFITGCCCLAIIPFFLDATKDVYHISPVDKTVVGIYTKGFRMPPARNISVYILNPGIVHVTFEIAILLLAGYTF